MYLLILLQSETVRELISTNDATIIGVLLGAIAGLVYWNIRADKKLERRDEYIREQDKANLIMLRDLIESVSSIGQTSEKNSEKIDGVNTKVEGVSSKVESMLTIIKERLTR